MKKKRSLFSFFLFFLLGINSSLANYCLSNIAADTTTEQSKANTFAPITSNVPLVQLDSSKSAKVQSHSPRKATLYSTMLPGLGQAYNKKYWKIPIVYAGFGAMTYFFTSNNSRYNKFKKALILRSDGDESTVDEYAKQYPNQQSLIDYKDYYRRNRDLSVIGFALFYVLNIVDANVDANLFYFDVSDDLSFQVSPTLLQGASFASGLSLKIKF